MNLEDRLEKIKNRMTEKWFKINFQYKHSIEDFCEFWEEYYRLNDRHKELESYCKKEYVWKNHEEFYVYNTSFNNIKYEIYYCGMKDKKYYCSVNGNIFELNSEFENKIEQHFSIKHFGFVMYGNVKFVLKNCGVRSPEKIFKILP